MHHDEVSVTGVLQTFCVHFGLGKMSNEHTSLDAAATERKARLARLALLKRKREEPSADQTHQHDTELPNGTEAPETHKYISGRNFDVTTNGPKLGFEQQPHAQNGTVEEVAERLVSVANEQATKEEAEAEKGIDLFKLQPKKPNWDLKRDLGERMKIVDIRTQNAIARLVRERIEKAKQEALSKGDQKNAEETDGQELGVEGNTLVQAVHLREREDEQERRAEAEEEEEDQTL